MNLPPAGGTDLGLETFLKGQEDSGTSGPEAGLGICRPAFIFPGVLVLEQTQGRALRGLARTSGCAKKKKEMIIKLRVWAASSREEWETVVTGPLSRSRGHWALAAEMTQWGGEPLDPHRGESPLTFVLQSQI